MCDNPLYIQRSNELCISPNINRKTEFDFKRKAIEKYAVDHTKGAQFGPVSIVNGVPFIVPFQGVTTARFLFIETTGEILLVFSGGSEKITVKIPKLPTGQTDLLGRFDADIEYTSLSIENPNVSGDAPCVTGYIYGD